MLIFELIGGFNMNEQVVQPDIVLNEEGVTEDTLTNLSNNKGDDE